MHKLKIRKDSQRNLKNDVFDKPDREADGHTQSGLCKALPLPYKLTVKDC